MLFSCIVLLSIPCPGLEDGEPIQADFCLSVPITFLSMSYVLAQKGFPGSGVCSSIGISTFLQGALLPFGGEAVSRSQDLAGVLAWMPSIVSSGLKDEQSEENFVLFC